MLANFQKLMNSALDISIDNAINTEIQVLSSILGKEQECEIYINVEELSKMYDVVYLTFSELSPNMRYIDRNIHKNNDFNPQWDIPDIPEIGQWEWFSLSNYPNHQQTNTYVNLMALYALPKMIKMSKMYVNYYKNILQERYVLLREFTRGIYKIKRKEFLKSLPKKLNQDLRLLVVSYLGDINGSNCYFAHLDNLIGLLA
jgi:hypothetical protein